MYLKDISLSYFVILIIIIFYLIPPVDPYIYVGEFLIICDILLILIFSPFINKAN